MIDSRGSGKLIDNPVQISNVEDGDVPFDVVNEHHKAVSIIVESFGLNSSAIVNATATIIGEDLSIQSDTLRFYDGNVDVHSADKVLASIATIISVKRVCTMTATLAGQEINPDIDKHGTLQCHVGSVLTNATFSVKHQVFMAHSDIVEEKDTLHMVATPNAIDVHKEVVVRDPASIITLQGYVSMKVIIRESAQVIMSFIEHTIHGAPIHSTWHLVPCAHR